MPTTEKNGEQNLFPTNRLSAKAASREKGKRCNTRTVWVCVANDLLETLTLSISFDELWSQSASLSLIRKMLPASHVVASFQQHPRWATISFSSLDWSNIICDGCIEWGISRALHTTSGLWEKNLVSTRSYVRIFFKVLKRYNLPKSAKRKHDHSSFQLAWSRLPTI